MGDVAVESPSPSALRVQSPPSTFPDINSTEVLGAQDGGDQYSEYKRLQRELEYINLQEEYIKDEQRYQTLPIWHSCSVPDPPSRSLKRELVRAQEEIKRIQSVPLVIGQFMEAIDQK